MLDYVRHLQDNNDKISFIPTMGSLHEGHVGLIKQSEEYKSKKIVSIFVNPLQFNDKKDFLNYPASIEEDINILKHNGVDCLFTPNEGIVSNLNYEVDLPIGYTYYLEGKHRPGHFGGVYKIVRKLFDIICPDYVFFGEKDYQQLLLIKFMVRKYYHLRNHFKTIKVVGCPTVRDKNGLALSSRNTLLTPEERYKASQIYKLVKKYEARRFSSECIRDEIDQSVIKVEYCKTCSAKKLALYHGVEEKEINSRLMLFYSGFISGVRLIDNFEIHY